MSRANSTIRLKTLWRSIGPPVSAIVLLLVALLTSNSAVASKNKAQAEPPDITIEAGPVIDGLRSVSAKLVIPAEPAAVWAVMVDCAQAPEFVPKLKSCEVVEQGDGWEVIKHRVKYFKLWPSQRYTFRADYQRFERIRFKRLSGDFKHLEGEWLLEETDEGHTLVSYWVAIDPGWFVPKRMVRRALRKDLPEVLMALRTRVVGDA